VGRQAAVALYVLALVVVVVSVDILFFRHHFWARLIVNIGIVLVFAAFGLRFLKRPSTERRSRLRPWFPLWWSPTGLWA
jgi:hypothetical protein